MIDSKLSFKQVVFVVGASRSGTSMMARMLGKCESVFSFNELHFFEELWNPSTNSNSISNSEIIELLLKLFSIQYDGYHHYFADENYLMSAQRILTELEKKQMDIKAPDVFIEFVKYITIQENCIVAVEQTPKNLFYINEISSLYPDSKFICLLRDPRDILKSQKNRWKRRKFTSGKKHPLLSTIRQKINYHPITISKLWNGVTKVIEENNRNPNFRLVKYEDLLSDTKKQLLEICEFLNISYTDNMMNIPKIGSSLSSDSPNTSGIDSSKLFGWKKGGLNTSEIIICEQTCKNGIKKHQYEKSNTSFHWLLPFYYILFPFQMFLILLFNLNKSKNVLGSIKRRLN